MGWELTTSQHVLYFVQSNHNSPNAVPTVGNATACSTASTQKLSFCRRSFVKISTGEHPGHIELSFGSLARMKGLMSHSFCNVEGTVYFLANC
mmetsp:Transcript_98038/g.218615  ORF Transcript_98038/g.218615 Transcript_98038/m.218615 type:complete len:93 (+) Transcript_98038:110-388(+)